MFKKILIVLAVLIAGILIAACFQPDTFHVERAVTIAAAPDKVLPHVDDFHNWGAWDPWAKLDPAMKVSYSGPTSGKGAIYEWQGNNQVGEGRMEITDATPSKTTIQLDFIKPMAARDTATFTFNPKGTSTDVTWAMDGNVPFVGKIFHLFMNMDKMVGGQFDKGLGDLKAASEAPAK